MEREDNMTSEIVRNLRREFPNARQEELEEAAEAARALIKATSGGALAHRRAEYLARAITMDHRTHQQSVFGFLVALLREWSRAADENRFDARNEYAVRTSQRIVEALDDDLVAGPYI